MIVVKILNLPEAVRLASLKNKNKFVHSNKIKSRISHMQIQEIEATNLSRILNFLANVNAQVRQLQRLLKKPKRKETMSMTTFSLGGMRLSVLCGRAKDTLSGLT